MPEITTTWANRKYDPHTPELVCAWDEYSIDNNYDGWVEDKQKALNSWGEDLLSHVDIVIYVPFEVVDQALNPASVKINATVVRTQDHAEQ